MMDLKETWPMWLAVGDVLPVKARLEIAATACIETDASKLEILHRGEEYAVFVANGDTAHAMRAWLCHYAVLYTSYAKHPIVMRALRCSQVLSDISDPEIPIAESSDVGPAALVTLEQALVAIRRGDRQALKTNLMHLSTGAPDLFGLVVLRLAVWCHVRDRGDLASVCFEQRAEIGDEWLAKLDRDVRQYLTAYSSGSDADPEPVPLDPVVAPRVDALDYERLVSLVETKGTKARDERRLIVREQLTSSSVDEELGNATSNLLRKRYEQAFILASNAVTQAYCMGTPSLARNASLVRGFAQVALGDYTEGFLDLVRSEEHEALHLITDYVERWDRVYIALEPVREFAGRRHPRSRHRLRAFLSLLEKLVLASSYPPPPISALVADALCDAIADLSTERRASIYESEAFAVMKAFLSREGWATSETIRRIAKALMDAAPRQPLSRSSRRMALLFLGELLEGTTLSAAEVKDIVVGAARLVREAPDQWFTLAPALHILGTTRALEAYQADHSLWEDASTSVTTHGFERPWLTRDVLLAVPGDKWQQWLDSAPIKERVSIAMEAVEAGQTDAAREIFDVLALAPKLSADNWTSLTEAWLKLLNTDDVRRFRNSFHSAFDAIWHLSRAIRAQELPEEARRLLAKLFPALVRGASAAVDDPSLLAPMSIPFDPEPSVNLVERLVAALVTSGSVLGAEQSRDARGVIVELTARIPAASAAIARVIGELSLRDQYDPTLEAPSDLFYYTASASLAKALAANDHDRVRVLIRAALAYGPRRLDIAIWSAALGIGVREEEVDVAALNDYLARLDVLSAEVEGQEWVRDLRPFPIAFRLHRTGGRAFEARIDLLDAFVDLENRARAAAASAGAMDLRRVYRAPFSEIWRVVANSNPNASQYVALVDRAMKLRNAVAHGTELVSEQDARSVAAELRRVQLTRPIDLIVKELGQRERWQDVHIGAYSAARSADSATVSELAAGGPIYSVATGQISLMLTRDEAELLARWFEENRIPFRNDLPITARSTAGIQGTDLSAGGRYIDQYRGIALVVDSRNQSPKPLVILGFKLQLGDHVLHPSGLYGGLMVENVRWWSLERLRIESDDAQRLALFFPVDEELSAALRTRDMKGVLMAETMDGTVSGEAAIEGMRSN